MNGNVKDALLQCKRAPFIFAFVIIWIPNDYEW